MLNNLRNLFQPVSFEIFSRLYSVPPVIFFLHTNQALFHLVYLDAHEKLFRKIPKAISFMQNEGISYTKKMNTFTVSVNGFFDFKHL